MLLSIIVPVYNGEKKIARCLNSLVALKESDIEFIIVNDGSTDNTGDICNDYILKDQRIYLINQKNVGVSGARNTGLKYCRGKYVAFVDADDEVTEDYNKVIECIKKEESELFAFDFWVQTQKNDRKQERALFTPGKNSKHILYNNYLKGNSNSACINIYKSELIREQEIFFPTSMSMGEDSSFNANYFKYCESVYYIDVVGYRYFTDDQSSASYARKKDYLKDFVKIDDKYLMIYHSCDNLDYPVCGNYHINNVYGILKRHRKNMSKSEKISFRNSMFCRNLVSQRYGSWKHEIKKWFIIIYLYII